MPKGSHGTPSRLIPFECAPLTGSAESLGDIADEEEICSIVVPYNGVITKAFFAALFWTPDSEVVGFSDINTMSVQLYRAAAGVGSDGAAISAAKALQTDPDVDLAYPFSVEIALSQAVTKVTKGDILYLVVDFTADGGNTANLDRPCLSVLIQPTVTY